MAWTSARLESASAGRLAPPRLRSANRAFPATSWVFVYRTRLFQGASPRQSALGPTCAYCGRGSSRLEMRFRSSTGQRTISRLVSLRVPIIPTAVCCHCCSRCRSLRVHGAIGRSEYCRLRFADATSASLANLVRRPRAQFGPIYVLVNDAGQAVWRPLEVTGTAEIGPAGVRPISVRQGVYSICTRHQT